MLDADQRRRLLHVARETIASALEGRQAEWRGEDFDPELRKPAGAFVTLRTLDGDLRGCVGSIYATAPLYRAVATSAMNAAFRDPRFFPLKAEELPRIGIEISVMGPIESVADVGSIEVGTHGLIVSRGRSAGLLLPQVATEQGWDRETFLGQTCVKAGLPPDAWRSPGCRIDRFAAEVFSE